MSTWTKQKLGDIIKLEYGKGLVAEKRIQGPFPVYGSSGIVGTHKEYFIKGPGIVIGRKGSVGEIHFVKDNFYPIDTVYYITKNQEKYDIRYLYYFLKYINLKKLQGDVGVPGLNRKAVYDEEVLFLNSISDQKIIASTLSAYDDLIEINEKRIKILEEMAQRLYTEWFVKFKFPGHEKVKMVDSGTEYGLIPEGWKIVPMSKLADFVNGYPFKPSELGDAGLPIIKIPELRSGILDKTPRNSGKNIHKKYFVKNGDILFSWSATLLVNIWNSGDAILNQHLFKVDPKQIIYKTYVYYLLKILVESLSKHVVGATMQHLRRGTVVDAAVLLPDDNVLIHYEKLASAFIQEMGNLQIQNQILKNTRDLLIPQLVTGRRELKN